MKNYVAPVYVKLHRIIVDKSIAWKKVFIMYSIHIITLYPTLYGFTDFYCIINAHVPQYSYLVVLSCLKLRQ